MKRKIIVIHEELCNGCGLCVDTCHEGAIELVDGTAKLVSDIYCDGLGDCLPGCPTGAIEMTLREAAPYDDEAVQLRMAERKQASAPVGSLHAAAPAGAGTTAVEDQGHSPLHGGCPGSMARRISRREPAASAAAGASGTNSAALADAPPKSAQAPSELSQWPIQLHLVNPANPYFDDAQLLIAADCTAFAYADFHKDFIRDRITLIGCPKLDDTAAYVEKLTNILTGHTVRSITVTRMAVPCCGGIVQAVKQAMLAAQTIVPYREVTIGIDGVILK